MDRLLASVLSGLLAVATSPVSAQSIRQSAVDPVPSAVRHAAERITAAQLQEDVVVLASDEMGGRNTPSRGLDRAAAYIVARLSEINGVRPAGDPGSYFQRITMRSFRVDSEATRADIGGREFRFGEDFLVPFSPKVLSGTAVGPLVYIGHGWRIPSRDIDSYKNVDIRGKVVIIHRGLPEGVGSVHELGTWGTDWEFPQETITRLGAVGVVEVGNLNRLASWKEDHQWLLASTRSSLGIERPNEPQLPEIYASVQ